MLAIGTFQIAFNIPNAKPSEFLKLLLICQTPHIRTCRLGDASYKTFLCLLFCLVVFGAFIGSII